jgi:hypothetical protein
VRLVLEFIAARRNNVQAIDIQKESSALPHEETIGIFDINQ